MKLDILIFVAHPDATELGMEGIIAKLVAARKSVGSIDLDKTNFS
jgi:LmbE family N-acetylglucosaminyl deacetylase